MPETTPDSPFPRVPTLGEGTRPADLRRRVTYLMLFRLVLISLVLGTTLLVSWLSDVDPMAPNSLALFGIIAITYLLTIVYSLVVRRTEPTRLADIQVCVDLVISALLLHITGGAQSAYSFFFALSIIAAATVRFRTGALMSALAAMAIFSAVSVLGWLDMLPSFAGQRILPSSLGRGEFARAMALNLAAFTGVAVLAHNLGGQIQQASARLETQRTATADLRALNEDIVRSLSTGLLTVDTHGLVLTINRAACKLLGIPPELGIGRPVTRLLPGIDALMGGMGERESRSHMELSIDLAPGPATGLATGLESRLDSGLGTEPATGRDSQPDATPGAKASPGRSGRDALVLGLSISPLRNNRDEVLGRIINFQDLTELRAMEQQIRQAERLAVVGTLAAGVAHEIRNPLAAISGSVELLRADPRTDDDSRALMNIVTREIDRLNLLITELLDYTNPQPREQVRFDVIELIRDTLAVFAQDPTTTAIAVLLEGNTATPLEMLADPGRIRQVLWNLLRNAVEAARSNVILSVERTGTKLRPEVEIQVIDDGAGIAPEHMARVFDPFFTTKSRGSGLGLAICHSIVTELGGEISVDSTVGQGSRFVMRLPLETSRPPARPTTGV